jgi:hypothetical protein
MVAHHTTLKPLRNTQQSHTNQEGVELPTIRGGCNGRKGGVSIVSGNMQNFLAIPNPIVDRVLRDNLSGSELKALLLCIRWTIGYKKETCTPSLTALSNKTGHARKFLSKVLKNLVDKHYIQLVTPPGFRKAAEYRVLWEWDSPTTVGQSDSGNSLADFPSESHGNGTGVSHYSRTGESHCSTPDSPTVVGHYIDSFHKKQFIDNENINTPLPPLQGELGSAEKRAPEPFSLSEPIASLFGKKKCHEPKFVTAPEESLLAIVKWYEEETRLRADLTEQQKSEFYKLTAKCNRTRFQVSFIRQMKKIKDVPIPKHLQGPGKVFMLLARAAADQVNQEGAVA